MKKYSVIYADPPWDYGKGKFPSTSGRHTYPLMPTADIEALPVQNLAKPDALLFIWTTMTHLPDALSVIDDWGFRYVTNGFTWIKTNPKSGSNFLGMGYWTRQNAELCLLGKRGRPLRQDRKTSSVIRSARQAHSQKPDIVRDKIVGICGDVPRIELFARRRTPGWDIWGNELENDVELINLPASVRPKIECHGQYSRNTNRRRRR